MQSVFTENGDGWRVEDGNTGGDGERLMDHSWVRV